MRPAKTFARRGVVEGFFGPLWTMAHRSALFAFGAARGMNTYVYAPKDDPYHRERWTQPYPTKEWRALARLIRRAQAHHIDFVYGFHPGKGLCFSATQPIQILLSKAQRFYDAGVQTFAVLFDDIPSHLEHAADRKRFKQSLARAEGTWLAEVQSRQPPSWRGVEWWICPSYYTPDPALARAFGRFEPRFLQTLASHLPPGVPCFWTGPSVVSNQITLGHVRRVARQLKHPLVLWDNYPVNDLSMSDELHIGPLSGRDPQLPEAVLGYLSNPLLQEALSFIPLATCFDYAADPEHYAAESSWRKIIRQRFGLNGLPHWHAIRAFSMAHQRAKKTRRIARLSKPERDRLAEAVNYIENHRKQAWAQELRPWQKLMIKALK
jgi:hyaluronoglucosaminidase